MDARCRRRRIPTLALALALVNGALLAVPRGAVAVSPGEVADVAFDLAVLRPLNATAVILGGVMFAVAAPFVAPLNGLEPAWETFVRAPWEYAVQRELGEF